MVICIITYNIFVLCAWPNVCKRIDVISEVDNNLKPLSNIAQTWYILAL